MKNSQTFRNFGSFLVAVKRSLRGRTILIAGGVVLVAVVLSVVLAGVVEARKEDLKRTGEQLLTSAQATDTEMFLYLISTQAGRTLVEGTVDVSEHCVKLEEEYGCFAAIRENKEHYVMKTETYSCGTAEAPRTCTRTYWVWESAGTNTTKAQFADILGVKVPYTHVEGKFRSAKVKEVREPEKALFGQNSRYYYESSHLRYSYDVVPVEYDGTAWLELAGTIGAKKFYNGKTITQVIEEASRPPYGTITLHWVLQIVLIAGAALPLIFLIRSDLRDGEDHYF